MNVREYRKGNQDMNNPEKLAILVTQDTRHQTKTNKTKNTPLNANKHT